MTSADFSSRCIRFLIVAALAALFLAPQLGRAQADSKMADAKAAAAPKMTGTPPAIRIKAGSDKDFKDHDGNVWIAEVGFEGGETIDRPADMKIENTKDPGLYQSERYSMDSFSVKVGGSRTGLRSIKRVWRDFVSGTSATCESFAVSR